MTIKRNFGEAYIKYKIRVGRGATFTGEIEGLKNAFTSGGVILILINTYCHVLLPLWTLPVFWLVQKVVEYFMGWYDEKHLHWWQFENRYVSSNVNPFLAEMMEEIKAINKKLDYGKSFNIKTDSPGVHTLPDDRKPDSGTH